ncbi:universal stress protein [Fulvivirga lutimaris]|uniref:universal stress protein n=1 Tax=Fulvivirga lutimaris TaxID=1819566 RepID=UPI0012BCC192|nr:universal stress protein [Fulvivirga lutimaris]MTI40618.1 universal stress protein [Fulvivirga lutimaris]
MNKILCPVDFSSASLNAIEYALEIAKKFNSRLSFLHVFTEKDFNKALGQEAKGKTFKELLALANSKLKLLVNSIVEETEGQIKCDFHIEMGDLIDKIKEVAYDENYDLVVMGTTGVSRVQGIFFGSNTEDTIDEVRKPILCVPNSANFKHFKKIVYASDFLEEDKMAIQEVISFATMFDARIYVLHINLSDSEKAYDKFVEELKSFIQYNKITFVNKSYKDDVGSGINEYMQQENADLLVAFKRKRNIVESMFSKSITEVLSYSTDKPLLVLKL